MDIFDQTPVAALKATGRGTGLPRRTPACNGPAGGTFRLIAPCGHYADRVRNIEADPRVRAEAGGARARRRAETAQILDDSP